MIFKSEVLFLQAQAKAYEVNGNKGVSMFCTVLVEGVVYRCKLTESQVEEYKPYVEVRGEAEFQLKSNKEQISLLLTKFTPE